MNHDAIHQHLFATKRGCGQECQPLLNVHVDVLWSKDLAGASRFMGQRVGRNGIFGCIVNMQPAMRAGQPPDRRTPIPWLTRVRFSVGN